mgnify:CR=1 FL=1
MKVKKIVCLSCGTELVSDYDKKNYESFVECDCENETSLQNYFTISQPGSIVRANDKSKVKAQALQDYEFCKKGEWWILASPDTKTFTKWRGRIEEGGFTGGLSVEFETEEMTHNECRTYLKTNRIMHEDGRIFHVDRGLES